MKSRYQRVLPFVLGAVMMLTLTALLARYRHELLMDRETTDAQRAVDGLRNLVGAQMQHGTDALHAAVLLDADSYTVRPDARALPSAPQWHLWRLSSSAHYATYDAEPPQIELASLQRALATSTPIHPSIRLLGPFSSEFNDNVITLATAVRTPNGALQWWGASIFTKDLMPSSVITDLMKQGLRVQLVDSANGSPLYQTDDGELATPVEAAVPVAASSLLLRAAPRTGWRPSAREYAPLLYLALAVMLWLSFEFRRGNQLRNAAQEVEEAEARRHAANVLYGKAIESMATLESQLQVVSLFDTVTGLANRHSLLRRLETELEGMRQTSQGSLTLLSIGLDHLHHIESTFGADFASRVLIVAAGRLEPLLPSKELLFRIGDAQLAIVLPQTTASDGTTIADRIVREIEAPITTDGHTFLVHPTIGIAETESGYQHLEALLDHANSALSAVPQDAVVRYRVFDSTTATEFVGRVQLEADLIRALEEQQFVLEYEPIIVPVSNTLAGFEALIRWNHPTEGRVLPGRFLPIANKAGMSHRIDRWVMRQAARQTALWNQAGYDSFFVAFNLSAEAFMNPTLESNIGDLIAEFELPPGRLAVEITESTLIQDLRGAARTLERLDDLGVKAWLDDFGTGYSSLSHLRELPFRGVKIDGSFIQRTAFDARDFGFLKSLIDLVSYLGMESVAEGVENQEQYELLGLTTCNLYQGHHFSRSMTAAEAERWMQDTGRVARREARA